MSRLVSTLVFAPFAALTIAACASALDLHEVDYSATDAPLPGRTDGGIGNESAGDGATGALTDGGVIDGIDDASSSATSKPDSAGTDANDCAVHADKKLYCTNRPNTVLRSQPTLTAPIVDTLRSVSSIFLCWGIGDPHAGGNSTWYYTNGDDKHVFGWTPAVSLNTPDAFDANPAAFGFAKCQ